MRLLIEIENQKRYLRAPTIEEIDLVLEHLGVSQTHFERFFNIYPNCIAQLHMGDRSNVIKSNGEEHKRKLPLKFWHIIFENLPHKEKKEVLRTISKPKASKPKIKRATKRKKVVMDEKILALL